MALANPVNPRKHFQYSLEFEGLEPALVQKVKLPTLTVEKAEHGAANLKIKTGGMITVGDLELEKLMFMNKNENWAYDWMKQVSNPELGTIGVPSEYKRNGYLVYLDHDLETILEKWQIVGAWPSEIEKPQHDRVSSENILERVVLTCDYVIRTS